MLSSREMLLQFMRITFCDWSLWLSCTVYPVCQELQTLEIIAYYPVIVIASHLGALNTDAILSTLHLNVWTPVP